MTMTFREVMKVRWSQSVVALLVCVGIMVAFVMGLGVLAVLQATYDFPLAIMRNDMPLAFLYFGISQFRQIRFLDQFEVSSKQIFWSSFFMLLVFSVTVAVGEVLIEQFVLNFTNINVPRFFEIYINSQFTGSLWTFIWNFLMIAIGGTFGIFGAHFLRKLSGYVQR